MKTLLTRTFLLFLLSGHGQSLSNASVIDINAYPNSTLDATAWALIYTYPLQIFANFAGNVLRNTTVNNIFHQRNLASPANPGVIKPNVDTLYSRVVLDLSSSDVVLTVPNISDGRYWNYPVYDAFGNDIANIGAINKNQAGDYLIRRAEDVTVQPGLVNATTNSTRQYRGIVNLPTTYGTILIRLLVKSNTTQDLDILHTYQNASKLTEVNRTVSVGNATQAPPLSSTSLNGSFLGIATPARQFQFAARLLPYNRPENYTDRQQVASILARAGLSNGTYHPQSGINLTQAAVIANNSITNDVQSPSHIRDQGNQWQLSIPSYQGNFGTNYGSAAYVALAGYQQLTTDQTLYPGYRSLGFTSGFNLQPNSALLVTFSRKPVLGPYGFWSLSVYGSDQYLIPSLLFRFSVGDRTLNLTYPDGSHVYGPQANASHDGPYQILLQPSNVTPPANWTNNWLPVDTTFTWIVRWYQPLAAMTNGSYVYPTVRNISAIRA